jgi:cytochrome P450
VRRCRGATFALTEMAEVLLTVLRLVDIEAVGDAEATHVHHITLVPARGAQVVVRGRRVPEPAEGAAVAATGDALTAA